MVKGKEIKLSRIVMQAPRGKGGKGFLTSALDGSEWSASRPGSAVLPGQGPPVPNG
jgi:hypothetical protein